MTGFLKIQDLGGPDWQLSSPAIPAAIPAVVPGDVYTDLLRNGRIEDPFQRDNEKDTQWIGRTHWVYQREFRVEKGLLERDRVELVCEGLDTLARIEMNGHPVAHWQNMFRTLRVDVRGVLRPGQNHVRVYFEAPMPYIEQRDREHYLPRWGDAAWGYLRKQACHFGWDFGVKTVTCGIWRPIRLEAWSGARIRSVQVRQHHHGGRVTLAGRLELERCESEVLEALVSLEFAGKQQAASVFRIKGKHGRFDVQIQQPQLWWPNNLGVQPLYELTVELKTAAGALLDRHTQRIGLRTIELRREKDEWGRSFEFVVNGRAIFAKGASWVPPEALPGRRNQAPWEQLLKSACEANMNMIRVWGGGVYEEEAFYDRCDELGLLIWQDFMFACSSYPTFDEAFMREVECETRENVERLRHHACLALWCGNNELEVSVVGGDRWTEKRMPVSEYRELFFKRLPRAVRQCNPDTPYWPGSPHSDGLPVKFANGQTSGDAHDWSVWHGHQPFEHFLKTNYRFVSEFGFQSFPELCTVETYTRFGDRNINSPVMDHHQRSPNGNRKIFEMMMDWFRIPNGFEDLLWLSQIVQAVGVDLAIRHWRRHRPRTAGALYWQLNDTWPAASWSSLDYYGRWKALHYAAKRFFAPVLLSSVADVESGRIEIHLTNDRARPVKGRLDIRITDTDGRELLKTAHAVACSAEKSRRVRVLNIKKQLQQYGPENVLGWVRFSDSTGETYSDFVLFCRPRVLDLPRHPKIGIKVKKQDPQHYMVTLNTRKPVLWCSLKSSGPALHFSDNFFHLEPGSEKTVIAHAATPLTIKEFRAAIHTVSLADVIG